MDEEMSLHVQEIALYIFQACGAEDDYCHQTGLVFGGTNRIVLTSWGWRAHKSHCTERFLKEFTEKGFGAAI
jgi:hypothetical protein